MPKAENTVIERLAGATFDLPAVKEMELEEAGEIYDTGLAMLELGQLVQGYAACCYRKKYGDTGMKRFVARVADTAKTVREHAKVYESLTELHNAAPRRIIEALRMRRLRYKHLRQVIPVADPVDWYFC